MNEAGPGSRNGCQRDERSSEVPTKPIIELKRNIVFPTTGLVSGL